MRRLERLRPPRLERRDLRDLRPPRLERRDLRDLRRDLRDLRRDLRDLRLRRLFPPNLERPELLRALALFLIPSEVPLRTLAPSSTFLAAILHFALSFMKGFLQMLGIPETRAALAMLEASIFALLALAIALFASAIVLLA